MWLCYLLLAIGAAEAGQSNIKITGTGTSVNGQTSLNINVQIDGGGGLSGKGGGFPQVVGRFPGKGGRLPQIEGKIPGLPGAGGSYPKQPPVGKPGREGGSPGDFTPFEQEALREHNQFRSIHAAPPMSLDKTMCREAAAYAAVIARQGGLQHSKTPDQGENLSMGCSTNAGQTATQAVTNWYNEVCTPGYNFGRPAFQGGTGHFTQVVWKASTTLGIGKADIERDGMKCTYIVGRYKPQRNFNTGNNDYQKNVLKGSFDRSYCSTISNNPSWDHNLTLLRRRHAH